MPSPALVSSSTAGALPTRVKSYSWRRSSSGVTRHLLSGLYVSGLFRSVFFHGGHWLGSRPRGAGGGGGGPPPPGPPAPGARGGRGGRGAPRRRAHDRAAVAADRRGHRDQ